MFDECEQVSHDLTGVKFVGETIDDRYARIGCKAFDLGLFIGADHHQIDHAADDFGRIFDGLGSAQLAVTRGQVNHGAAHLVHASFKTDARAGGGLFKNHGQGAVCQWLVLVVGFEFMFDECGARKQIRVVICCQVFELQIMGQGLGHVRPWRGSLKIVSPAAPTGPPLHRLHAQSWSMPAVNESRCQP